MNDGRLRNGPFTKRRRPSQTAHRNGAVFQALLTGVPPTENHILKQLSYEASFLKRMREQFPTLEKVAVPLTSGKVS